MKRTYGLSLCVIAATGAALAVDRMSLLPPESLLKFRASNTVALIEAVKRSPLGTLWQDPAMQDFLKMPSLYDAFVETLEEGEDEAFKEAFHLQLQMYLMLKGEVALGIKDDEPYLVAWMSKEDYARSLQLDRRIVALQPESKRITRSRFHGVDVYEYTERNAEDAEQTDTVWSAAVGETVISGPDREWVQKSIAALERAPVTEPQKDARFDVVMDLPGMLAKVKAGMLEGAATERSPSDVDRVFSVLGIDEVGAMKVTLDLKPDALILLADIPVGTELKGVLSLLDVTPVSTAIKVPFASEDVVAYSVMRFDLNALWGALPGMAMQIMQDPTQQSMVLASLGQLPGVLGVDLGNDLLAHLGTQYLSLMTLRDDTVFEVGALEVRNEEALKASIEKMFSADAPLRTRLAGALKTEEIRGHRLYLLPKAEDPEQKSAVAVAGGYLLLGDAEGVRAALTGLISSQSRRFYGRPEMVQLQKLTPSVAMAYSFTDLPRLIKALSTTMDALRDQGVLAPLVSGLGGGALANFTRGLDVSKIPDLSHVATFFGPLFSHTQFQDGVLRSRSECRYPESH